MLIEIDVDTPSWGEDAWPVEHPAEFFAGELPEPWEGPGLAELPGSGFAALELDLATARPGEISDDDVVGGIAGLHRVVAWAQARQTRLLAELVRRRGEAWALPELGGDARYAPDEVAVALRLSRGVAAGRLYDARRLVAVLPEVLDAWEAGRLDGYRVRIIVEAVAHLDPEKAAAVAARVLPAAGEHSPGRLRAALARAVIAVDPEGANARHRRARTDRRVSVHAQSEGMASLWAYLSAPDARSCWEWLTRMARGLGADDPRKMDARRADLLVALLTGRTTLTDDTDPLDSAASAEPAACAGSAGAAARPDGPADRPARERCAPVTPGKPLVTVVIPYRTLTGASELPGVLAGYGPIPADLAREIAADSVWKRLLHDPLSGTLLDHGRTTYHPPAALADHVRARDLHCRGPHCPRPASACELDHNIPYPDGPTSASNLGSLCKIHHNLKHHGRWRVAAHDDGTLEWITPTGHRYTSHPHDYRVDPIDLEHGLDDTVRPPPRPDPPPAMAVDDDPPF